VKTKRWERIIEVAVDDLMVWLIVGMLAGSLAGLAVRRKKAGFGKLTNKAGK
jgi:hypothetical protein